MANEEKLMYIKCYINIPYHKIYEIISNKNIWEYVSLHKIGDVLYTLNLFCFFVSWWWPKVERLLLYCSSWREFVSYWLYCFTLLKLLVVEVCTLRLLLVIPPASTKLRGGYTGYTLSICPSVRLSVCGQNHVRSVSSKVLIGSFLYLHILSSNLRNCVACNVCFKMQKKILANSLNL